MDITKVIAISGYPGLYKVIAQATNGLIVESLVDKKRMPAYSSYKISSLTDISIFTTGEDKPLKTVLQTIFDMEKGAPALEHKSTDDEVKTYFGKVVPDYDKERVRISDMKKALQWYNILQKTELLSAPEPTEEEKISLEKTNTQNKAHLKESGNKSGKTSSSHVKAAGVRKTGVA